MIFLDEKNDDPEYKKMVRRIVAKEVEDREYEDYRKRFTLQILDESEIYDYCLPYYQSQNWYLIIASDAEMLQMRLLCDNNFPGKDVKKDIIVLEEKPKIGRGLLVAICRKDTITLEMIEKEFAKGYSRTSFPRDKDLICINTGFDPKFEQRIKKFQKRLEEYARELDRQK